MSAGETDGAQLYLAAAVVGSALVCKRALPWGSEQYPCAHDSADNFFAFWLGHA